MNFILIQEQCHLYLKYCLRAKQVEIEVCFDPESQSLQTNIIGQGESDYTETNQCLPDKVAEMVQKVLMTSETDCSEYAKAMVKLSAVEEGAVSDTFYGENNESAYDANKSMCEITNHTIRKLKEQASES